MVGIFRHKWFFVVLALFVAFSCVKEEVIEQAVDVQQERFAEYDPVVRFGLDTYMGGREDSESLTKTIYAGDGKDRTYVLNSVRYERINWNGKDVNDETDPKYQDVIQILSQTNFTPKDNKTSVSYKVKEIADRTNPNDNSREDVADAEPFNSDEKFYWSRPAGMAKDAKYYFYALYPTSDNSIRLSTKVSNFSLDTTDPDPAKHLATVSASINEKGGMNPDSEDAPCRKQEYLDVEEYTDKLLDANQKCFEYLPDMKNAYLYAAAVMPGADAGYKRVPLRFKPLYSAIKLVVQAGDDVMKNYRLKRVDLRTDLHQNGDNSTSPGRRDLNPTKGTALGGRFSTSFKALSSGTTADFTPIDPTTAVSDTLKRLFIDINPNDRKVLKENLLKLTFLVLPIEQKFLTVEYTFEFLKGSELDSSDPEYLDPEILANWTNNPSKVVEVHRYLSLQNKTYQNSGKEVRSEFSNDDLSWYTLDPANKLYIRSSVPAIEYVFKVQTQANFPRTWNSSNTKKDATHFYSEDFYSVQSYRDSSGVMQPLKWKVTGYKKPGDPEYDMGNKPDWLTLRGDDGTWNPDEETTDLVNHGWDATGDPWEKPWGAGTPVKDGTFTSDSKFEGNERNYIKGSSFVSYVAAAEVNGDSRNESLDADGKPDVFEANRDWDVPVSYLCRDLDGKYYFQEDHMHTPSAGWKGLKGESYAYDLSSHDIYGNLYTGLKNGDLGTTANTYVVSAPGWYRFPAVYGCSVKNGVDNNKSYTGAEGFHLLKTFLNHADEDITSPAISGIADVDVLWDDATHMVAPGTTVLSRADRKPFYHKDPSETYGYIYFYVDDIAQGNALLVAKDDGGTIVWSWQIWAVTKPETFLKKVGVESNSLDVNDDPNPYKSIYGTNYFWQKADLGQHGKESGIVEPRYCDVEFTQYFQGKELKKVVVRFLQSGVNDVQDEPIFYQWGRKDPMPRNKFGITGITSGINTQNTGRTIREPNVFFGGTAYYVPTGERYDNLWNTNITAAPTTPESDGTSTGSLDRYVEKTIYDPSPAGFHTANLYALSGFNPVSPINETKIRVTDADEVAKGAETTPVPKYNNIRYFDFFTEYDESATYKRKKDGETIRFYVLGRLKANDFVVDNDYQAFYFLSEPGSWVSNSVYYGRSFWIGTDPVLPDPNGKYSTWWNIYPVAGATNSPKWQRNHALPVRPMMEP